MARSKPPSVARLEARLSLEAHALIKRAAELEGRSITDFVVNAAQEAAQHVIEQSGGIRLSLADQQCFADAMISPPEPNAALQRAFDRRKSLLQPSPFTVD